MKAISLYNKTSAFNGIYIVFLVNRLQMLYFVLLQATFLVYPHMIWAIVAVGALSQINLILVSKCFSSELLLKGYQGYVELFGKQGVRILAGIGLLFLIVKIIVTVLGYMEMVHYFVFPSMDSNWLILSVLLLGYYVAAKGMDNTIRYVSIVFLCTFWMIGLVFPFFFPPIASIYDLFPLVPTSWTFQSWKGVLLIWSSLSGPEYLLVLLPWLGKQQKSLKYLSIGNAISVAEYLLLFIAAILFFGSHYLDKSKFPVKSMIRYLQSPIFERIDILMVSLHIFLVVFAFSIFMLMFYGGLRIVMGRSLQPGKLTGFVISLIALTAVMIILNEWIWKGYTGTNMLLELQIWLGALTYLLVPSFFLLAIKRKERLKL
ncbi:GerAB/ArcD/ProY family transporter [Paenibacillus abyssi]|uniref:Uncharacterized protein n=1 Tax=Paenibacillus abyssi TaxID=1340531 RepID=A0A917CZS8_9BACL|nr:GerAB/ArcD/ProY family transporter [Paenibacillus abyssi]GGG03160.1 hypothetical protein GCM10010916_20300 [Paenibacillus abyssi]